MESQFIVLDRGGRERKPCAMNSESLVLTLRRPNKLGGKDIRDTVGPRRQREVGGGVDARLTGFRVSTC